MIIIFKLYSIIYYQLRYFTLLKVIIGKYELIFVQLKTIRLNLYTTRQEGCIFVFEMHIVIMDLHRQKYVCTMHIQAECVCHFVAIISFNTFTSFYIIFTTHIVLLSNVQLMSSYYFYFVVIIISRYVHECISLVIQDYVP